VHLIGVIEETSNVRRRYIKVYAQIPVYRIWLKEKMNHDGEQLFDNAQ